MATLKVQASPGVWTVVGKGSGIAMESADARYGATHYAWPTVTTSGLTLGSGGTKDGYSLITPALDGVGRTTSVVEIVFGSSPAFTGDFSITMPATVNAYTHFVGNGFLQAGGASNFICPLYWFLFDSVPGVFTVVRPWSYNPAATTNPSFVTMSTNFMNTLTTYLTGLGVTLQAFDRLYLSATYW